MPIIEIKNLYCTCGKKQILNGMNLSIDKGKIIGIVGNSGSGKSLLAKILSGIVKPTSGSVFVDSKDIWKNKKNRKDLYSKVGVVFQYPEYQLFEKTVYKDISFGLYNMGFTDEKIKEKVKESLKFVRLSNEILNKSPFEISSGEKRKVAIASVVSVNPEIIILDEPTASLDPKGKKDILLDIKRYHEKNKNTVVIFSNNMEEIMNVCDEVVIINNGKVLMHEETKNILKNALELQNIEITIPEISNIMLKLRKKGYKVNTEVFTIDDGVKEIINLLYDGESYNG